MVGVIPDFILGMRYSAASGMHSKFAYVTNTRYMHPIMGGTWRWFGQSSTSFRDDDINSIFLRASIK